MSSPDKNGYPVVWSEANSNTGRVLLSPDGNTALYSSYGAFADAEDGMPRTYRAIRGQGGWESSSASPKLVTATPELPVGFSNYWILANRDLDRGLVLTFDNLTSEATPGTQQVYTSTSDGTPTLVSRAEDGTSVPPMFGNDPSLLSVDGMTDDASRAYFSTNTYIVTGDTDRTDATDVYERAGDRTTLLNQRPDGSLISTCGSVLGGTNIFIPYQTNRNAISAQGDQVVFSVPAGAFAFGPDCFTPTRIYTKSDSAGLVEISASEATVADAPAPALYQGAAVDGSRIIFSSPERLIDGIPSGGLYAYDVSAPRGRHLRLLVATSNLVVVKPSDDGHAVYFTSVDALAPGATAGTGLYLYKDDDAGNSSLRWIADDPITSFGDITSNQETDRAARISRDGTVLSFVSSQRLTGFNNVDPRTRSPTAQVFVYDDRVGLRCASCNPAGQRPASSPITGDASVGLANASDPNPSFISDDGNHVFFSSPDRLVRDDVNSRRDVYEYSGGRVQLISTGRGDRNASLADVSASGDTVLFSTTESLVPDDVDGGDLDMYVSRVGGGFARPSAPPSPGAGCDNDPCQGQPAPQPADDTPGSSTLVGGDDAAPASVARPTVRVLSPDRSALRNLARSGRATIRARAAGPGTVRITLTARVQGKTRTIASGRIRVRGSGTTTVGVSVTLSSASRRALARQGRLAVRVRARFTGQPRESTVKVVLRSSASPSRGGRR